MQDDLSLNDRRPSADVAPFADGRNVGRVAFALGLLSSVIYYGTSEGIRNFVSFVVDVAHKALRAFGHGA